MLEIEEAKRPKASEILTEIGKMKITINSKQYIKKEKVLGKGGYGYVELLQYSTALFALKIIDIGSKDIGRFKNEVEILKKLNHTNLLRYVEAE